MSLVIPSLRPLVGGEHLFPQAQRVRCYLYKLVVADELDGLLEVEFPVLGQAHRDLGGGASDVG